MLTTNITFEKIIEKTKRMLGKNYRGDKELVPVYSTPVPIEGHTDAFLSISNNKFSQEDVETITEKTKTYSWWVAFKGYLVDETKKEIPALFIEGSTTWDNEYCVLNFDGTNANGFYSPINRTNILGGVTDTPNQLFIQVQLENEIKTYDVSWSETGGNKLELDGTNYEFFAGRLYPEDKVINDGNLFYPIYLVSNLDYYYIPVAGEKGELLEGAHTTEFVEKNNLEILEDVCNMVVHEASQWTNRRIGQKLLDECWPIIVKCSCIAYLNRGVEHLSSQSELGQQNVFNDWTAVMHKQLINRRAIL